MELPIKLEKLTIDHALDLYEIMQMVLRRETKLNQSKEHFWVVALNNAHRVLNLELVATGSNMSLVVKPMEVLSIPLQKRAMGVMLVHNHPSGSLQPSEADEDLTDQLIQACKLMKTPVLDHVIITERSYYSFKESGLLSRLELSKKYVLAYELEEQHYQEMKAAVQESIQEGIGIGKQKGIEVGKKEGIKLGKAEGIKQGKEEGLREGIQLGKDVGRAEEKLAIAKNMLKDQEPIEKIARWTGLGLDAIKKLQG